MTYETIAALSQSLLGVLADVAIKSAALGAVAAIGLRCTTSMSASFRHRVWMIVLGAMLMLPVSNLVAPGFRLAVLPYGGTSTPSVLSDVAPSAPGVDAVGVSSPRAEIDCVDLTEHSVAAARTSSIPIAFAGMYLAGVVAFAFFFVAGLFLSRRRLRMRRPIDVEWGDDTPVFECDGLLVPVTTRMLRPIIVLPTAWRSWSEPKLAAVLAHERAHVARGDYAVLMVALVNRCVFWFHPVAWIVLSRLSLEAELACDEAAVRAGSAPPDYARYLVDIASALEGARRRVTGSGLAMASQTKLSHRIDAILAMSCGIEHRTPRRARAGAAVLVTFALGLVLAGPSATHSAGSLPDSDRSVALPLPSPERSVSSDDRPAPYAILNPTVPANDIDTSVRPDGPIAADTVVATDAPVPEVIQASPPAPPAPSVATVDDIDADTGLDGLSSPNAKVRERAVDAIFQTRDPRTVLPLIRLLKDENLIVRQQAARVLGRLGDGRAVGPLITSLDDASGFVREQAAESLGLLGARSAVDPLIRTLGDGNANVRQLAARSLGRIGDARADTALAEREHDPNAFVRDEAVRAREQLNRNR